MLVVGERINATRKKIGEAVQAGDAEHIKAEATKQVEAGAHFIDVNGGIPGKEKEYLQWLVDIVQEVVEVPLCLDSADADALAAALPKCQQPPMINSITFEKERLEKVTPLVTEHNAKVIALCLRAPLKYCKRSRESILTLRLSRKMQSLRVALMMALTLARWGGSSAPRES